MTALLAPAGPAATTSPVVRARPLVLGYVRVWLGASADVADQRAHLLADVAEAMGCTLGQVFTEDEPNRPLLAFGELLASARVLKPIAVLVSHISDLGSTPSAAMALRQRVEREVGVPLLVAQAPSRRIRRGRG